MAQFKNVRFNPATMEVSKVGSGSDAMTVVKEKSTGKVIKRLYNPAQRRTKYCRELSKKTDRNGNPLKDTQLAYRSGYMDAHKEQSRIFKKKNPGYQRKTK